MRTKSTDRDALNRALHAYVLEGKYPPEKRDVPPEVFARWHCYPNDYCRSLQATVAALGALGLQWTRYYYDGWHVAVGPDGVEAGDWPEGILLVDGEPATLANALVQSALQALELKAGHAAG